MDENNYTKANWLEKEAADLMLKKFGYFDRVEQTEPAFDPGLDVECLACHKALSHQMATVSVLIFNRSYFYRLHDSCNTDETQLEIEKLLVDAIYKALPPIKRNIVRVIQNGEQWECVLDCGHHIFKRSKRKPREAWCHACGNAAQQ